MLVLVLRRRIQRCLPPIAQHTSGATSGSAGADGESDAGLGGSDDTSGDVDAGGISIDTGKVIGNNKGLVIFSGFLQSTPEGTAKIGGIPCPAWAGTCRTTWISARSSTVRNA